MPLISKSLAFLGLIGHLGENKLEKARSLVIKSLAILSLNDPLWWGMVVEYATDCAFIFFFTTDQRIMSLRCLL